MIRQKKSGEECPISVRSRNNIVGRKVVEVEINAKPFTLQNMSIDLKNIIKQELANA